MGTVVIFSASESGETNEEIPKEHFVCFFKHTTFSVL